MKKILILSCVSAAIILFFNGCGKSAVECDTDDVKGLVMQIANDDFQKTVEPMKTINPSFAAEFSKQWSEQNPKLVNIRTNSKDDELEKSECAAQITMDNGNIKDITYTLSKTSEGELFAEVSGL
jgi:Tfp pilus assembly protein PilP